MKLFAAGVALIITIVMTGCGTTNNYYTDPEAVEVGNEVGNAVCQPCQNQIPHNQCQYGGGMPGMAVMPVMPMMVPQATQIVTSYEEVYATEYTANGPVVKKQLIPIRSTVPVVAQPMLMNTPNGYGASYGVPIAPSQGSQQLPTIIGTPPAQPVVPGIEQPVAWFGPTAAPNYSTQTNWF